MKVIKCLAEQIGEELEDAENYAKCAIKWATDDRRLADTYYNLSTQELSHVTMLHDSAVRIINEASTEAPESMKEIWDWEHERMTDKTAAIKVLLQMYKN